MSSAAASKYFLLSMQKTVLLRLCSVEAVWVPSTRLQLLSQPSLKCESQSLKAQGWNFLWSFPNTATDYRITIATGMFCHTLT